ncbi:5-oxoprolinase subunit B family protein [Sinomonas gamaensis]|uniref:5-oxoprolinase subunit B family protein n=1 Tax=Sinomonas gamaensis TaxID=2565624 RepID=UPI0011091F71|nr:carboxyltransferase domain-containing protein [Sinomonas gamaensis]
MAEHPPGSSSPQQFSVTPYGDSAVLLTPTSTDPAERRLAATRLRAAVAHHRPRGVVDLAAGLESLLVEFDPLQVSHDLLEDTLLLIAETSDHVAEAGDAREFVIPTVFGGDHSPDLPSVASELGLTVEETITTFTGSVLTINLLASAMAPMMAGVQFPRQLARLAEPRTDVPSGSIMVAGTNAIIQPFPGPTGWRVIGRTPLTICDISRDPAVSFRPGDTVRFTAIPQERWDELAGEFLEPVGGLR